MPIARRPSRVRLWHVLVLFAFIGLTYCLIVPDYEASEEPHHLGYVRYLIDNRSLPPPDPERGVARPGGESETHQPPLYYAIVALATSWIRTPEFPLWHRNPYATWQGNPTANYIALHREDEGFPYRGVSRALHASRIVSLALGLVTVACTYYLARLVLRRDDVALGAAAIAAFTPGFLFSSASVNNDNGVILFSSLVLLLSAWLLRRPASPWRLLVFGLAVFGAVLSKGNGLIMIPISVATLLALALREATVPPRPTSFIKAVPLLIGSTLGRFIYYIMCAHGLFLAAYAGALVSGASLPGVGRMARGVATAGSWLSPAWLAGITTAEGRSRLVDLAVGLFTSYWGVFGWLNVRMSTPVYLALLVVCLAALVGLGDLLHSRERRSRLVTASGATILLLLLSIGATSWVVASRFQMGTAPGMEHGRFLFPVISPLSILLAAGLAQLKLPRVGAGALPSFVLLLLALSALAPFVYIRPFYSFPAIPVRSTLDPLAPVLRTDIEFENGVSLVGFTTSMPSYRPDDEVGITLYWKAERDLTEDFVAFVHLLDLKGAARAGLDSVPLDQLFPPKHWEKGEFVREQRRLKLPDDMPPGLYSLSLGLYAPLYDHGEPRPIGASLGDGSTSKSGITIGQLKVRDAAQMAPQTTPVAYDFNHEVELIGYEVGSPSSQGATTVSLYWQRRDQIKADYTVSLRVMGEGGELLGQHDGQPGSGLNPTSAWLADEIVRDDHTLALPAAGPSQLRLAVVVYNLADRQPLPVYGSDDKLIGQSAMIGALNK
ncbi:MAG: glycosyltransferase family 39 protein [Chloroflexi bacterium]|nr:glycosyltransferase family 39 protein [Chloroflexota bacterium]